MRRYLFGVVGGFAVLVIAGCGGGDLRPGRFTRDDSELAVGSDGQERFEPGAHRPDYWYQASRCSI